MRKRRYFAYTPFVFYSRCVLFSLPFCCCRSLICVCLVFFLLTVVQKHNIFYIVEYKCRMFLIRTNIPFELKGTHVSGKNPIVNACMHYVNVCVSLCIFVYVLSKEIVQNFFATNSSRMFQHLKAFYSREDGTLFCKN